MSETMSEEMIALADELEAIRRGVDAFNPDMRSAARSAFEAAEQVWKLVPRIITTLRAQPNERLREALEGMPDEIEVWRIMQRTGGKRIDMARAVADRIKSICDSALSPLPQGEDTREVFAQELHDHAVAQPNERGER
jgi:hypothetical protein